MVSTQCCAQLRTAKSVQCIKDRQFQRLTCTQHKNLEKFIRSQLDSKQLKRVLEGAEWMAPMRHERDFIIPDSYVELSDSESDDEDEEEDDLDDPVQTTIDDEEVADLNNDLLRFQLATAGRARRSSMALEHLRAVRDAALAKRTTTTSSSPSAIRSGPDEYLMSGALPDERPRPAVALKNRSVRFDLTRPGSFTPTYACPDSNRSVRVKMPPLTPLTPPSTVQDPVSAAADSPQRRLPVSPTLTVYSGGSESPSPTPTVHPGEPQFSPQHLPASPTPTVLHPAGSESPSSPTPTVHRGDDSESSPRFSPRYLPASPTPTIHPGASSPRISPRGGRLPRTSDYPGLLSLESSPRSSNSLRSPITPSIMSLQAHPRGLASPLQMRPRPATPSSSSALPSHLGSPLQMPPPPSSSSSSSSRSGVEAADSRRQGRRGSTLPRETPLVSYHLPHAGLR